MPLLPNLGIEKPTSHNIEEADTNPALEMCHKARFELQSLIYDK